MEYEEAVRRWAVMKLSAVRVKFKEESNITVDFDLDPGYACCGGRDPGCYCSYAESPSLCGVIRFTNPKGKAITYEMKYLDFEETLHEVLSIGSSAPS